jgi:dTDP-4-amino-4,6-dideoxygalactose transaminase
MKFYDPKHNPYAITAQFEDMLANYAGSKYCVCVESCSAAILLSLFWQTEQTGQLGTITIPKFTYPSAPCSVIFMGGQVHFSDESWEGIYYLKPYQIVDGALRFRKKMYEKGTLHCISMHIKKRLNLGRGGAILTDDGKAYEFLKRARFDGRAGVPLQEDSLPHIGLNVYMEPSNAARGIQIFQTLKDKELDDLPVADQKYSDLSIQPAYQKYIV